MGERGGKFARSWQERREGNRAPRQLEPGDLPASPPPRLGPQVPHQPRLPQPGGFLSGPPPKGSVPGGGWGLGPPAGASPLIPAGRCICASVQRNADLHV